MIRIAVLISNKGTGSNLAAVIKAIDRGEIKNAKVAVVVSNKEDAYGLIRAKKKKIHAVTMDLKDFIRRGKSRTDFDAALGKLLKKEYKADLVVLAGWMLILSEKFIKYFPNKTINLHPGLLPSGDADFIKLSDGTKIRAIRGLHTDDAVQFAIDQGYPATGSTVHFITPKVDQGPVIIRSEVKILPNDTVETLYKRMKDEEHKILPKAIALFCENKLRIKKGKVIIKDAKTCSA
ncbi:phosphoribosylglycinamide formyltransferase [Candidatus Gottesmanbacteria bacterium]|nr:phosphoribosylglycinamide formyltransferase [Candidatus Gottesmanbacteria bacterium]